MPGRGGERLDERNEEIWKGYCEGQTQTALARQHGLSRQRVGQVIEEIRAAIPPEDKEERVMRHLAVLDAMAVQLAQLAAAKPIPAYSNGRPIYTTDDEGREVVADDHSGRIKAMSELRSTLGETAKLLGLYARTETGVTVDAAPEIAALLHRAALVEADED